MPETPIFVGFEAKVSFFRQNQKKLTFGPVLGVHSEARARGARSGSFVRNARIGPILTPNRLE